MIDRLGSGALFRDDRGRVLLVRPSYKESWEIPGGAIEDGESPRTCCRREVHEELGLEVPIGRLLVVDWLPPGEQPGDGLMFVYDGGELSAETAAQIRLPADELLEWRFLELDDLDPLVPEHKARRIRAAHRCALEGTARDLEHGFVPDAAAGSSR